MLFLARNAFGIDAQSIGLPTSTTTISGGITGAISLLIQLVGLLAVVVLIFGGVQFAASQGNAKNVQQAKDTIQYAVIGLVVAIVAYAGVYTFTTFMK